MSFDFGQLPGYRPKLPNVELGIEPFSPIITENDHHVLEISLNVDEVPDHLVYWLQKLGIGRVVLTEHETQIGTACATPSGFLHAELFPEFSDKHYRDKILKQLNPLTFAINHPTRAIMDTLKEDGYLLRTEFIRWFARVGPEDNPIKYLSAPRAKKMRANIRKARSAVDVKIEPLTIENFKPWLSVYEQEVVARPGGTKIFYCDVFLAGKKMEDMRIISCFSKNTGDYLGGCIVNPWGTFADIGGSVKKYTTFLMSAFNHEGREHALGYLLEEVVMNIARENGCEVYGHGGDINFWGTDILPGLLGRKSAVGMQPFPDTIVQAFKVTQPDHETFFKDGFFFFELIDPEFLQVYFDKREKNWKDSVQKLIKAPWENPDELDHASHYWNLHHVGNAPTSVQAPEGMHFTETDPKF